MQILIRIQPFSIMRVGFQNSVDQDPQSSADLDPQNSADPYPQNNADLDTQLCSRVQLT